MPFELELFCKINCELQENGKVFRFNTSIFLIYGKIFFDSIKNFAWTYKMRNWPLASRQLMHRSVIISSYTYAPQRNMYNDFLTHVSIFSDRGACWREKWTQRPHRPGNLSRNKKSLNFTKKNFFFHKFIIAIIFANSRFLRWVILIYTKFQLLSWIRNFLQC